MVLETLRNDDRAIEGLPVRLVIAFVVGMATLSVMLNMLSGVGGLAVSELDVRPSPDVMSTGERTVEFRAVDASGDPVSDATVIVRSGTASIGGVKTARTDDRGVAELELDPTLEPNQADGTLRVDLKPPAGTKYVDERENTEVLVIRET